MNFKFGFYLLFGVLTVVNNQCRWVDYRPTIQSLLH